MRHLLAGWLAIAALAAPAAQQERPAVAPLQDTTEIASYDIDVTLDPGARTLTGREIITWRNPGMIPAYSIRLHLYWNAFRSTNSSWLRQRQLVGDDAFGSAPEEDFGYTQLTELVFLAADGTEVNMLPLFRYISPDDQNRDDRSLAAADLPVPVPPGDSMRLRVAWTGRFPKNFDRTGAIGNYFFVSQWFPKLGVFQAGGWTAHQFFANSEFFSDFGRYDVRMTVPAGWTVGATGVEQSRTPNGTQVTHRYVQDKVHDFAWTTSPDFVEQTKATQTAQTSTQKAQNRDVTIRLLLQPDHVHLADRHFAAAEATLRYFGEWFGPYPYSTLTIVDPAYQSDSDGMEYPTIFTAGARWLSPRETSDPEYVVIHETGHQFWQGMVANNEVLHAWLDEGITEYADSRLQSIAFQPNYLVQRFFGDFIPWQFRDIPLQRATDTNWMNTFRRAPDRDPLATPTYLLWPDTHQNLSYHKAALLLHTLERVYSWEVMQRVFSTFFTRWQYKHPTPDDFFAVLTEVTGQDQTAFLDQAYRNSYTFDYAVERFASEHIAWRGLADTPKGGLAFEEHTLDKLYRTTVVVRRLGAGQHPVDVRVLFEDGHEERERWDGRSRWQYFTFDRPARAVSAEVDPERRLLLDTNFTNNSKTLAPMNDEAATKWSLRWMIWLQDLFMTCAFLV